MAIVRDKNKDCNVYSLVLNKNGKSFIAPVLFTGEKWRLITQTKINLNKYGFSRFLVPKGRGIVENLDIYKNTSWYIF